MSTEIDIAGLAEVLVERGAEGRSITAIAGPPAAGKSTLADELAARLNARAAGSAAVLPMDGYHFDDRVLEARGWRARKGAPHTFDVGGLAAMLRRLAENEEEEIAVPVFDRDLEIARAGARLIPRSARHLIVEGNYLLLRRPPWPALAAHFDTTVALNVDEAELERRLGDRWAWMTPAERAAKIGENDLPNAQLALRESVEAEFVLRSQPPPDADKPAPAIEPQSRAT